MEVVELIADAIAIVGIVVIIAIVEESIRNMNKL